MGGTTWPFLTFSPDGDWIQIQLPGRVQAWVATQLVLQQDAISPQATVTPTLALPPVNASATPEATATPRLLFTTPLTHRVNASDTLATIAKQGKTRGDRGDYGNPQVQWVFDPYLG